MAIPVITGITQDTGSSASDGITSDTTLFINGTSTAGSGATVSVLDGVTLLGTTLVDGSGNWSFNNTASPLSDGTHSLTATDTGGTSNAFVATIDTTMAAPALESISDDTGADDSFTSTFVTGDNTLLLSGLAEANSFVEAFIDGVSVAFTTADGVGNYIIDLPSQSVTLADGEHSVQILSTDAAGNSTFSTTVYSLTIDTAAPSAPVVTDVVTDTNVSGDGVTSDSNLIFNGTAEANSAVEVFIDNVSIGTTTASGSGAWSFDYTSTGLSDDTYSITAKATDAAANTSAASASFSLTVDSTPPAAPSTPDLAAADDTGQSNSDNITFDTSQTISGSSEANAVITLFDGATPIGTTAANGAGDWTFSASLAEGGSPHSITAKATDLAGNQGAASLALSITVDNTSPATPSTPDLDAADDTGSSSSDNLTGLDVLTLTGTSDANNLITIKDGGTTIGTTLADGSGNWTFNTPSQSEGAHSFTATPSDVAGNAGSESGALAVTTDYTTPTAPVITGITDDTGGIADGITQDTTLVVNGTAEANAIVYVYLDGASIPGSPTGSTTADGSGNWSFDYTGTSLGQGAHTFKALAQDQAGNINTASVSNTFNVTIDTVAPVTPTIDLTASSDSVGPGGTNSDNITNDTTPTFTGTAEAGTLVALFSTSTGGLVGTVTADGSGNWIITSSTVPDGAGDFYVGSQDLAGNFTFSTLLGVTIDSTAPGAPVLTGITTDTGESSTDEVTRDRTLIISGTAEASSQVQVFKDGSQIGTTTADGSGNWTFDYTSTSLSDNTYLFSAKATDVANNTSVASADLTVVIDNVAPNNATITDITNDTGTSSSDEYTSDTNILVNGTAEAGANVEIFIDGVSQGTTIASGSGAFTVDATATTLTEGTHDITSRVLDLAGNSKTNLTPFTITVDTTVPGTPSIDLDTGSDTAGPNGTTTDNITKDNTPSFSGVAEANSIVTLYDGSTELTTTANGSGAWSITNGALADGNYTFFAWATDKAGNVGSAGGLGVTIDTVAAASVTGITNDTGTSGSDGNTSDNTLLINGTADASSTVQVFRNASLIGTATADGSGNWSFDYTGTPLADGSYAFTSKATDVAGNVSPTSSAFNVTIDSTTPPAPGVTGITTDTGATDGITSDNTLVISGVSEANAIVEVFQDAVSIGTVQANGSGVWSFNYTGTPLADDTYAFTATQTDLAGHTSATSNAFNVTVDTTGPTTPTDVNGDPNTIAEDVSNGASTGLTASSSEDVGTVSYSLTDNPGGRFTINSTTGIVTVLNASLINFEDGGSYDIEVTATNIAGSTNVQTFAIAVTNVAPGTPSDTNGAANQVNEHASNGTTVGLTAFASDPHGGALVYSLLDDAGGRFTINPTTGVVTVLDGSLLDFATDTSHDITVQADDGGAQTTQDFTINVLDVVGVTIIGSKNADTIDEDETAPGQPFPTFEGDTIFGMKGDDSIFGLGGDDIIDGGAGTDNMHGGDGNDTFVVHDNKDYFTDTFDGGAGSDTLQVTGTKSVVLGGLNVFGSSIENILGNGQGILGTNNADGFDLTGLTSISGVPFIDGGAGNDTLIGTNLVGNDLRGGAGNDTLTGHVLADTLTGGAGADIMNGSDGNDTFKIVKSDGVGDTFSGGADTDTLEATGKVTLDGFNATASSIEQWVGLNNNSVLGTNNGETFNFSGLTSMTGLLFVDGGKGEDALIGSNFVDTLKGGDNNDVLLSNAGNDFMTGGKGFDDFQANTGDGVDTVTDYKGGEDQFFVGRAGIDEFSDLNMTAINNNHDVQIDFGGGDMLIIQKTTIVFLTAHQADFIFF